ncbi:MAG: hypothetical protein ACP5H2_06980 [Solirubrobacteraceae bacterium]
MTVTVQARWPHHRRSNLGSVAAPGHFYIPWSRLLLHKQVHVRVRITAPSYATTLSRATSFRVR